MELTYKKASVEDIDTLTSKRIELLRETNKLSPDADMSEVEQRTYEYYLKALPEGSHTAYLIFDGDVFVGSGGVSYFRVMPTCHNPSGRKAYIMNIYTIPAYRRKGIARQTLDLLVEDAKSRGIRRISLEATDLGLPLYEKYGFIDLPDEMEFSV